MSALDATPDRAPADWLNRHCHCIELDRGRLAGALELCGELPDSMFARYPVFTTPDEMGAMRECIEAVEEVAALPAYRERALSTAPASARTQTGARGALLGYDFHLGGVGPQLIEINTNAGGALLSLGSARAQELECAACAPLLAPPYPPGLLEERLAAMFAAEWRAAGRDGKLERIAIVDEAPRSQYLYPEFLLYQQLLERAGFATVIAGPDELQLEAGRLVHRGRPIDLVYNRLTDFALEAPASLAIAEAHASGAALVTPDPRAHALFARKSNLALLSDAASLEAVGAPRAAAEVLLRTIPTTLVVTPEQADELWTDRKRYYFKPVEGFGSRATYAGAKLTRRTWASILEGRYVAQELVAPCRRVMGRDAEAQDLKLDVRHYTYAGETQLVAARLYRGQTTNFRTPGGGFAPVLLSPGLDRSPASCTRVPGASA